MRKAKRNGVCACAYILSRRSCVCVGKRASARRLFVENAGVVCVGGVETCLVVSAAWTSTWTHNAPPDEASKILETDGDTLLL